MMGRVVLSLSLLACIACGSSASGSVEVSIDGESGAVDGYPLGGDPSFVDGWSISFDRVVASVQDVRLQTTDGDDALLMADPVLIDLSAGPATTHEFEGVPAQRWDSVSYRIAPATAASRLIAVDESIRSTMVGAGAALLVEGTATRDAESIDFSFAIPISVDSMDCESGVDGTAGMVVTEGGRADAALTLHFDHLFFDDYSVDGSDMRFDAMAATAVDGRVDLTTLATQNITDLRDAAGDPLMDGEGELVYDPGTLPIDGGTLADYVIAAATTIGHFQGEGHCEYEVD